MNPKHPIVVVIAVIFGSNFMACSTFGDTPGRATDGGADGGVVGPPVDCDVNAEPKDAPACVVNDYGVFVDSTAGVDSNPGTREAPLKTIAAALANTNGKPRIYLCDGNYTESIDIHTAVSVYGGFTCSTWVPSGQPAVVAPPSDSIGLTITGVAGAISISDINLDERSASKPGGSSIAAFVSSSSGLVNFVRTRFTALDGADGASATASTPFSPGKAPAGQPGTPSDVPRVATINPKCTSSIGGKGAANAGPSGDGESGLPAIAPPYPDAASSGLGGGVPPNNQNGSTCGAGDGQNGSDGLGGVAGTTISSPGELSASGWIPADGAEGGAGQVGQGGGGGGTRVGFGGTAGAGGAGGCGGGGGGKGGGGGSSIALLVFQSTVTLKSSFFNAGDGGKGGDGAAGQIAQVGASTAAPPTNSADACLGGLGGAGGSGAGGGGGAGGLSVGVLFKGTPPTIDGAAATPVDSRNDVSPGRGGAAGSKGMGGAAVRTSGTPSRAGKDGNDGPMGTAKAIIGLQ